jgi:hypothetical protein
MRFKLQLSASSQHSVSAGSEVALEQLVGGTEGRAPFPRLARAKAALVFVPNQPHYWILPRRGV